MDTKKGQSMLIPLDKTVKGHELASDDVADHHDLCTRIRSSVSTRALVLMHQAKASRFALPMRSHFRARDHHSFVPVCELCPYHAKFLRTAHGSWRCRVAVLHKAKTSSATTFLPRCSTTGAGTAYTAGSGADAGLMHFQTKDAHR